MFKLVYVFDYREKTGYEVRLPKFLASLYIRARGEKGRFLDSAPTPEGY